VANNTIFEGLTKPLVEISVLFRLTPNQVANEASLQTALKLAKLRASDLARIEDLIIFQGNNAFIPPNPLQPRGINVRNQVSAGTGLLGVATDPIPGTFPPNPPIRVPLLAPPPSPPPPGVLYGQNTLAAVVRAIGVLNGNSQPGPFALILDYRIVADVYSVLGGTLTTTADLITPLVTGGLLGTAALPPWTGLLVSLGGEPTTIYVGVEATAAFATESDIEDYRFRVFERVQFDARDPRAFVRLDFAAPKPTISEIDPKRGKAIGGEPITITGQYFAPVTSVDFGGAPVNPPFEYVDDGCIKVISPRHAVGLVHIRVTTTKGNTSDMTADDQFTYYR